MSDVSPFGRMLQLRKDPRFAGVDVQLLLLIAEYGETCEQLESSAARLKEEMSRYTCSCHRSKYSKTLEDLRSAWRLLKSRGRC